MPASYQAVVRQWFELTEPQRLAIAASLGLPSKGERSSLAWNIDVICPANETGKLPDLVAMIAEART